MGNVVPIRKEQPVQTINENTKSRRIGGGSYIVNETFFDVPTHGLPILEYACHGWTTIKKEK